MPNWVYNRVRIEGSAENVRKAKEALRTCDKSEIEETRAKLEGRMKRDGYETDTHLRERLEFLLKQDESYFTNMFDFNSIIPMPENSDTFLAKGGLGPAEKEKFGENNWYDWSISHWGTKWNSCDARISDESDCFIEYEFDTAWAPPEAVIPALAEKFGVNVTLDYYDADDFPSMAGEIKVEDGDILTDLGNGDVAWIAEVFGEDVPEMYGYVLEDGAWTYNDPFEDEEESEEKEQAQPVK